MDQLKTILNRRVGPFPVWAWMLIVGAGVGLAVTFRKLAATRTTAPASGVAAGTDFAVDPSSPLPGRVGVTGATFPAFPSTINLVIERVVTVLRDEEGNLIVDDDDVPINGGNAGANDDAVCESGSVLVNGQCWPASDVAAAANCPAGTVWNGQSCVPTSQFN